MSKKWPMQSLGDLCDVIGGGTPPKDRPDFYTGDIPWATVRDMRDEVITKTEFCITRDAVRESSTNIIPAGNVVIATRVGLGKVCLLGQDTAINQDLRGIIPRNKNVLSTQFLFWWFRTMEDRIIAEGTGATVQGVKLPFIKSLQIPTPPLEEQREVADSLDEAFKNIAVAKANIERNLKNTHALFESQLNTILVKQGARWSVSRLGDVCITAAGGTPLKSKTEYYYNGDIPWLMSGEISQREILSAKKFITQKGLENSSAKMFPKDTVLVAMYGATAGVVGILRFPAATNQAVCGILPNEKFIPEFVFYVLLAKKQELVSQATGNAQPNISQIKVRNIEIPTIPLHEQHEVVKKLKAVSKDSENLVTIYQKKLSVLHELKKSLLHKAFEVEFSQKRSEIQASVPTPYMRNQVHAAIINQAARDGGSTTEVAVAKYDHLLQEVYGLSLGYQFETQQFGPFDGQIKRLISSGFGQKNRWFTKRNGMLVPGSNIAALLGKKRSGLYQDSVQKMQELAKLGVTKLDTDRVELLSTACHSIKETGSLSIDKIRGFMAQWPTDKDRMKADKFTLEQTQKCLDFIIKNNLHKRLLRKT